MFETKRLTRSGSTRDVWVTLSLLTNDQNQPVGIATTERDIIERKQSEQRLRYEIRSLKVLNSWLTRYRDQVLTPSQWNEVCQILVEEGGYRLCWMAKVQNGHAEILSPAGWRGFKKTAVSRKRWFTILSDDAKRAPKAPFGAGSPR